MFRVVVVLACTSLAVTPAAAEYRLRLANVYDATFFAYLDGPIERGEGEASLDRLGSALDAGTVPSGGLLYDRTPEAASRGLAAAFGALPPPGAMRHGEGRSQWVEARWLGADGRRVVWVIAATRREAPQVRNVALQGRGGRLSHFIPYRVALSRWTGAALSFPLEFVRAFDGRPAFWERYLSGALDLRDGLAVVVGVNPDPPWADHVYIVIDPIDPPGAAVSFKAVVAWGERTGPGGPGMPAGVPVSPAR